MEAVIGRFSFGYTKYLASSTPSDADIKLIKIREHEGRCIKCGIRTHILKKKGVHRVKIPLSTASILNGRCLLCNPIDMGGGQCPSIADFSSQPPFQSNPAPPDIPSYTCNPSSNPTNSGRDNEKSKHDQKINPFPTQETNKHIDGKFKEEINSLGQKCGYGIMEGRGEYQWDNGDEYDGEWKNYKMEGRGIFQWADGTKYDGEWKAGERDGRGKYQRADGRSYDGEWKASKREGRGVFRWNNGDKYDGEWKHDKRNGRGKYQWVDGRSYDGEWKNNKREGKGVYQWKNGDKYDGEWKNHKMEGRGIFRWADGEEYDGEWKDGKREGRGKFQWVSEDKYDGEWKADKRDGKGKFYFADGGTQDCNYSAGGLLDAVYDGTDSCKAWLIDEQQSRRKLFLAEARTKTMKSEKTLFRPLFSPLA